MDQTRNMRVVRLGKGLFCFPKNFKYKYPVTHYIITNILLRNSILTQKNTFAVLPSTSTIGSVQVEPPLKADGHGTFRLGKHFG
jgi:hypothetical protein